MEQTFTMIVFKIQQLEILDKNILLRVIRGVCGCNHDVITFVTETAYNS